MAGKPNLLVGNFLTPGWETDASYLKDFVLVTEENRKKVIVVGRVLYTFRPIPKGIKYFGFIDIWPKFIKGWQDVKNHALFPDHDVFLTYDMSTEEYRSYFEPMLTKKIEEKVLYLRLTDKLAKYTNR